ncbi:hypothetical protein ICN42_09425 [Polynucleobacter sp. 71A-WALBACH]|uniref:hypothetical protein n=1 Tax=Polynucleobacter sp. 71A-WALBACH TaxID=2689097 RepID=UPI001C0DC80A|nr:hypothetical protein [Polynucleobacter sp. 71A-WALBACH]MBU3594314.1 hypothetical protein [Polynucleobacter sp. 71A-WALBACH]
MIPEIYEKLEQAYKAASEPIISTHFFRGSTESSKRQIIKPRVLPSSAEVSWGTAEPNGIQQVSKFIDPEPYYIAFQFAFIKNSTKELCELLNSQVEMHPSYMPILAYILENFKSSLKQKKGLHQQFILSQKRMIYTLVTRELIKGKGKLTHARAFENIQNRYKINSSEISEIWNEITAEIIKLKGFDPFPKRKTRPTKNRV